MDCEVDGRYESAGVGCQILDAQQEAADMNSSITVRFVRHFQLS